MPLFCDAYLADTMHLSLEEHGAYLKLLIITWRNNGQPIPDEDARLARMLGVSVGHWRKKLRPVLEPFFDLTDGTFRQKRLEKEWLYTAQKIEKNRENGRRGAEARALKDKETATATAEPNGAASEQPNSSQTVSTHPHPHKKDSVADATGAEAPQCRAVDPAKRVYDTGKDLLARYGIAPGKAGGLITAWRKRVPDKPLLEILVHAGEAERAEIVAFIEGCMKNGNGTHRRTTESLEDRKQRDLEGIMRGLAPELVAGGSGSG